MMGAISVFRIAPAVTLALLLGPILVGIVWTMLPAFGWLPAIGGTCLSLVGWQALVAAPGFLTALRLTVVGGALTTIIALAVAIGFCAIRAANSHRRWLDRWLAPLLATPHSAMALGFAFLVIPSGWIVRLISPWATGFDRPPADLVTVHDPFGLAYVIGLLLKEVPYLALMIMTASAQVPVDRTLAAARALGQPGSIAWLKAVFPKIYPQIRLPIFAVLAFSFSAVDVGLILAPGNPPPLSVLATRWFSDYNLERYYPASAAALLQLVICLAGMALWRAAEPLMGAVGRYWVERGGRDVLIERALRGLSYFAMALGALGLAAIGIMAVWSVAGTWWYPDALPRTIQWSNWAAQGAHVLDTTGATLAIAIPAVGTALLLSLACLENEQHKRMRPSPRAFWLLYLPLLVPQIAYLFGVQTVLVRLGIDGTLGAVAWVHLTFVLPYVFLSLADPYRALDPRYATAAAALGASPTRVFLAVKLPLLVRPILVAGAVGFAVSVGQYLPTMFAGAGRISTLTTEAVTLASGGDRRVIGVYTVLQSSLPLLAYGCALLVPLMLFRHRRALTT